MATHRTHITIDRPAEEVWSVVSDAGNIFAWFPLVETSEATDRERHCTLQGDVPLDEEIVTNDPDLRRFQYRIVGGGLEVETHLGTVDVLDLDDRTLIVYSTEVTPDQAADTLGPAIEDGVRGLKEYCEKG